MFFSWPWSKYTLDHRAGWKAGYANDPCVVPPTAYDAISWVVGWCGGNLERQRKVFVGVGLDG